MNRYSFFDEKIREDFIKRIAEFNLNPSLDQKLDEYLVVIAQDMSLDQELAIEDIYNEMLDNGLDLWGDTEEGFLENSAAGVQVSLTDGTPCVIRFEPETIAKLMSVFEPEELEDVVQHIARSAENPSDAPICEMPAETLF